MTRGGWRWGVTLAAGLAALGATGCARLARQAFQQPTVVLQDVVVRGLGAQGGAVDVILTVDNPNGYRLDAERVTYRLFADSAKLAEGAVDRRVTLPEKGVTTVTLPVAFTYRELMSAASVLLRQGTIDYRVTGEVTVATPFGRMTRAYDERGRYAALSPGR